MRRGRVRTADPPAFREGAALEKLRAEVGKGISVDSVVVDRGRVVEARILAEAGVYRVVLFDWMDIFRQQTSVVFLEPVVLVDHGITGESILRGLQNKF